MDYAKKIQHELERHGIRIGDLIRVMTKNGTYEGTLMPKSTGDPNTIVLKLASGYNVGIAYMSDVTLHKEEHQHEKHTPIAHEAYRPDASKKIVCILHTGGTIASRIDYETGGVTSLMTPEEILLAVPELKTIVNIKTRQILNIASDDMNPEHWALIAQEIAREITTGVQGIIVTLGTDTMHYVSAALSFMVQNLSIPVLFVGSQRSADRGSSDATMNLLCAAHFIAQTDFTGVAVCMHGSPNDSYCFIHAGT
ncbi:MAG: asparaginase, partial [Candidatus Aenigmarchaeota archaeon]|nr:asparaginase [Candidatus Aenigmarchaeota archaeon]